MNAYQTLLNTKCFQLNGVLYDFDRQVPLDWDGQSTAFVFANKDEMVVVSQDHSDNPLDLVVAFIPTSFSWCNQGIQDAFLKGFVEEFIEDAFMKLFDRDENDTFMYDTTGTKFGGKHGGNQFRIDYCFGELIISDDGVHTVDNKICQ